MKKSDQLNKLAKTLENSGLAANPADAMKRAKDILKIRDPVKKAVEVDPASLPKIDDIKAVENPSSDVDKDSNLKDLIEEDASKIYDKQDPRRNAEKKANEQ